MTKILIDKATVNLVLEALEHCKDVIVERGLNGNPEFADKWGLTLSLERSEKAIAALKALDHFANVGKVIEQPATTENNGGKTGWPPGLLQDDCKGLSKWLSNQPDAKRRVREALAEQPAQQEPVANALFMRKVLSVAIAGLYEHYKDDVLRVFTIDDLETVIDLSESLRTQQVQDIYKRAWVMLAAAPSIKGDA